ncbi:Predicted membrane protein [Aedoeadaptatus ivorii]|uniref:Predicted membrane protein n=1 Tax=Aedoeadaptatus ivorii TaxID=54006 RepID=A0A3S4Y8D5_9FIRM|nr:YoaK family protein [Peptoniphilus ivorii]MDQ0508408.1 uncharacterized membrane protein YoaK (UPF0700 family) [Peptoniphilus ivorii]VEJ36375.1 Predicted membrane protein [Peptoniphilus ivorii]
MARREVSESLIFATFLTLAGGLQDSYSYALRGKVFVNALTGNVVLLALNVVEGNGAQILHFLFAILSFALGVYVSAHFGFLKRRALKLKWQQQVLFFEILILCAVGLIPVAFNDIANGMMAFSCGMQVNAFREFADIRFATTMCVGNMRTVMDNLAGFRLTKKRSHLKKSGVVFYIVFVFFTGAALGGLLFSHMGLKTIWVSALFLAIAFVLLMKDETVL